MTINLSMPSVTELKPRISVVGVGGAGGNAVNNMINAELEGVDFVVTNTDAQALSQSLAEARIQLGVGITQGLGAGSRPDIGCAAAEEATEEIRQHLQGSHMVFITAGMGGGTGTGAAPVIAQIARDGGALTVGVVTKPFQFEGAHRMTTAESGMEELQRYVDTLIIIPNQNLFRVANEKTTFAEAFKMADDVLYSGVRGVTDLMVMPGLINLDFADIRTVMMEMGKAMMGTGEAEGERRATEAAEAAISNPLLDEVSMKGACGVLINITGGLDMTLFEVDEAANRIREEVEADANIIFGSTFDESMDGIMRVSVVATGIGALAVQPRPEDYAASTNAIAATGSDRSGPTPMPASIAAATITQMAGRVSAALQPITALKQTEQTMTVEDEVAEATAQAEAAANRWAGESEPAAAAEPESVQIDDDDDSGQDGAPATKLEKEPFIPPQPQIAAPRPSLRKAPDPFAEAAVENAGRQPQKREKRGLSLFERMTGSGRARKAVVVEEPAPSVESATATATGDAKRIEPTVAAPAERTEPRIEPTLTKPAAPPAAPVSTAIESTAAKTPSEGLDLPQPESEEDLLEIPAFLRRQAN